MPKYAAWGLNGVDAWPKKAFLNRGFIENDYAEKLYSAKILLKEFYYGQVCGFKGTQMPTPGFVISEEDIGRCLAKIDKEWLHEQNIRGGISFKSTLKFSDSLGVNQKLALIERLVSLFPNWPKKLKEAEERQIKAAEKQKHFIDEPL